jgi:hypothetical protein
MECSQHLGILPGTRDSWSDPVLSVETPLFRDPFLLYAAEDGRFGGAHDEVSAFFNAMSRPIGSSGADRVSVA